MPPLPQCGTQKHECWGSNSTLLLTSYVAFIRGDTNNGQGCWEGDWIGELATGRASGPLGQQWPLAKSLALRPRWSCVPSGDPGLQKQAVHPVACRTWLWCLYFPIGGREKGLPPLGMARSCEQVQDELINPG